MILCEKAVEINEEKITEKPEKHHAKHEFHERGRQKSDKRTRRRFERPLLVRRVIN